MTPRPFRQRPVLVEAMQWDGTPAGATPIINWILACDGTARWHEAADLCPTHIAVDVRFGTRNVWAGHWIIREEPSFLPLDDEAFREMYEPAEGR